MNEVGTHRQQLTEASGRWARSSAYTSTYTDTQTDTDRRRYRQIQTQTHRYTHLETDRDRRHATVIANSAVSFGLNLFADLIKVGELFALGVQKLAILDALAVDELEDEWASGDDARASRQEIAAVAQQGSG
jgi:hypothetical protein